MQVHQNLESTNRIQKESIIRLAYVPWVYSRPIEDLKPHSGDLFSQGLPLLGIPKWHQNSWSDWTASKKWKTLEEQLGSTL